MIELGLPTGDELAEVVKQTLPPAAFKLAKPYLEELIGYPHAAAEYFANSARRRAVLAGVKNVRVADIAAARQETTSRPWL